jgi:conjugal transfer pilus assembly protein TraD
MRSELNYEMPWRPNYEAMAIGVWIISTLMAFWIVDYQGLPERLAWWFAALATLKILLWSPGAISVWQRKRRLKGLSTRFIRTRNFILQGREKAANIWLGWGFDWQQRHAQLSHEIMKRDLGRLTLSSDGSFGAEWIHGLEPKEKRIHFPIEHIAGHTLIVGTTGSGKTRTFDLLITQAVLRGEAVIIIDPKGDRDLCEAARRACEVAGCPERFMFFHPAHPDESFRINPLLNFTRPSELAGRIAQLIPSESGTDPFKAFGQKSLDNIIQGLLILDQRPTLLSLRHYLEGGPAKLITRSLENHFEKSYGMNWMSKLPKSRSQGGENHAVRLVKFYRDAVEGEYPNSNLEGLISMFEHDRAHFGKMIANLLPIMNMLTTGALGGLLSPDENDKDDSRPFTDSESLIEGQLVTYIGLDSLSDGMVGSAIGAILLADLASVAGKRYNFGSENRPVNIFVDEAAEVINDPCIQLLNKGRGAMMRLFIATQTFADFVARTGSEAKARQILANVNNLIALRVLDSETQRYITDNLPLTRLRYIMRTQGLSTHADNPAMYSGNLGERLMEEEGELFPPQLLGMLPNLHFIAKLSGGRICKGRIPILMP